MADAPVVHIGENSPEYVAFRLYDRINALENHKNQTREQVLDLYAECLLAVKNPVGHLAERHERISQNRR